MSMFCSRQRGYAQYLYDQTCRFDQGGERQEVYRNFLATFLKLALDFYDASICAGSEDILKICSEIKIKV